MESVRHSHSIVEDGSFSFHLLHVPKSEKKTQNRNVARTHVLKSQKCPEMVFDSEIQWGMDRYEPWGEFESIKYTEIHWKTQIL